MDKTFADMLSTRSKNGLVGCLGDRDIINQPERIAAGRDKLTRARNIGSKSLKEIAFNLSKYGFIKYIEPYKGLNKTNRGFKWRSLFF
jgi:hypothetical protein